VEITLREKQVHPQMDFKTQKKLAISNIIDTHYHIEHKDFYESIDHPISFDDFCAELKCHGFGNIITLSCDDQHEYDECVKKLWDEYQKDEGVY
jgi:hypothetical protein